MWDHRKYWTSHLISELSVLIYITAKKMRKKTCLIMSIHNIIQHEFLTSLFIYTPMAFISDEWWIESCTRLMWSRRKYFIDFDIKIVFDHVRCCAFQLLLINIWGSHKLSHIVSYIVQVSILHKMLYEFVWILDSYFTSVDNIVLNNSSRSIDLGQSKVSMKW